MFWWTLENLFCDRMIMSKSVMRTWNVLMSHASLLTMLWWTLENLFCDRMIMCLCYQVGFNTGILMFVQKWLKVFFMN